MPTQTALMAPPLRPWKAGEAQEHGNCLLSSFFNRSRRGHPKKSGTLAADKIKVNAVKRGCPPSKDKSKTPKPKVSPKAASPTSPTAQKKDPPVKRTNWTLPENQAVLQKAVDGWLKEQDSCYDSNGEKKVVQRNLIMWKCWRVPFRARAVISCHLL